MFQPSSIFIEVYFVTQNLEACVLQKQKEFNT